MCFWSGSCMSTFFNWIANYILGVSFRSRVWLSYILKGSIPQRIMKIINSFLLSLSLCMYNCCVCVKELYVTITGLLKVVCEEELYATKLRVRDLCVCVRELLCGKALRDKSHQSQPSAISKVHVTKRNAHANSRSDNGGNLDQACRHTHPSAISTAPGKQSKARCCLVPGLPPGTLAKQSDGRCGQAPRLPHKQRRQSQPSAISATPAGPHQGQSSAIRATLPGKVKVDVPRCRAWYIYQWNAFFKTPSPSSVVKSLAPALVSLAYLGSLQRGNGRIARLRASIFCREKQ